MRRLLLIGAVLLAVGCRGVVGPFEHRAPQRVDDPNVSISEQQRRARDRLPLPEQSGSVAPRTYIEFPDPHGR
jgi:hypothetical protein